MNFNDPTHGSSTSRPVGQPAEVAGTFTRWRNTAVLSDCWSDVPLAILGFMVPSGPKAMKCLDESYFMEWSTTFRQ